MSLSDVAIRRPVFTAMLSLAILVLGLLSYGRLATDLFPAVDFPIMMVRTVYPGASPEDIERDVTRPIEDALAGISGIDKLQSFTRDSASVVVIQFEIGTDLDAAVNQVRDGVGSIRGDLPRDVQEPVIDPIDIGALPVMVVTLATNGDVNFTRELAEERLRPLLEQVEGVGTINVIGGQDREVTVDLDLDRLSALGIPATQVAERIGWENLSLPVGQFDAWGYTIGIRADGEFESVDDLRQTVVHMTPDGRQVRLGEVADVRDGWSRPAQVVRNNGQEAVALEVVKKSGANTVWVAESVKERLAEVVPTLGHAASYSIISDQSIHIEANAHEVWIAIYFGGAMAVLVILFFLLDVRGTLISALALPTSIVGTFAAMYLLDFTINNMTLLAMSLAIGLLIDDAVVVRESITHRLEQGDSPEEAASRGTREIALAVLATTFSLVAVFVPVAFMTGMVGQFFKQFGLTIAVAVLISLFVAFTLDPMLSARLSVRRTWTGHRPGLAGRIERFLDAVDRGYREALDWVLRWPKATVGLAVLSLLLTGGVAATLPTEFVPKQDRGEFLADLRLPVGTALGATDAVSRPIEAQILALPGIDRVYTIIGHEGQTQRARYRIGLVPKGERGGRDLSWYEEQVRALLSQVPTAEVNLAQPGIIDGLGDWPPLMLIIQGPDLEGLYREGERIRAMLAAVPGATDVRVNVNPGRPELAIDIDRSVASDRGIPAGLVGSTARLLVEGQVVGALRDGGPEADIRVRAAPRYAADVEAIRALPLPSPRGAVQLGDVATVEMGVGASEINRNNRMRSVTVSAWVGDGASLGAVLETFQKAYDQAPLPEGYVLSIDGQARDMQETAAAMGLAIAVASIFVFMVLASQFESLLHPFTLMVSVPLAMVGAFLGLAVTGNSISMGSQIGIILLMGLVTKNAILLVDGALQAMRDGSSPVEALRMAGPRRLRPILMTSAAMILGMIPTAVGTGVGAEFRAPMAIAVIGGVASSTVLTLLVVPVVFLGMERVRGWSRRLGRWIAREPEDVVPANEERPGSEVGAAK